MKKKIRLLLIVFVALWLLMGAIDFVRVNHFKKPLFCIQTSTGNDGYSGHYVGLGYSADVATDYMLEGEPTGAGGFNFYIFGIRMESGIRD